MYEFAYKREPINRHTIERNVVKKGHTNTTTNLMNDSIRTEWITIPPINGVFFGILHILPTFNGHTFRRDRNVWVSSYDSPIRGGYEFSPFMISQ